MAAVSSRSHGGAPNRRYAANPFDSDDEDDYPTTSSTSSRSQNSSSGAVARGSSGPQSTGYVNPFDDEPHSGGHTKSRTVAHGKSRSAGGDSSNPFDDDYSPPKPARQAAPKGSKLKFHSDHSSASSGARDTSNPFDDDYEVTSKPPKSKGDAILDKGSLFDDDETAAPAAQGKERKAASSRPFASRIKESGTRLRETASSSLSAVKLPSMPSASAFSRQTEGKGEKGGDARKAKAEQQTRDLFGDPKPVYQASQHTYYPQQDETRFEDQTVEQLEQYAVSKSQDTTSSIRNAIKIAEDTKGVATTTLETLHDQGEQIRRTHDTAVRVEEELGRGEKLLGNLGGMFSMTWKPKKGHKIQGPQADPDHYKRRVNLGERSALGLNGESASRPRPNVSGMSTTQAQLEMEKHTQDDALSDLSNVLGQLKGMTIDMGTEIDRQNGDLDRMQYDVQELNERVKGANNRTRHLLRR